MTKKFKAYAISFFILCSVFACADTANEVVTTIAVGQNPAGIAVTPNNLFAYVANSNNNTVTVLNLTSNTVETTINDASFDGPYTVTINAAGTKAYITNSEGSTVTIIDIATNTVIGTITGFDEPSGFAITPDGNFAYVNNYADLIDGSGFGTTVNVVDLNSNTIVGPAITVGQAPAALAITPDGAFVYVVNYVVGATDGGTISIIQTSNNSATTPISGLSGPFAIAITPDGDYAYVANFGSNNFSPIGNTVSVVDLNSNTIVATILVGVQPAGIAITPDGSLAYVSNYSTLYNGPSFTDLTSSQGTVNIIDIQTNTVISPIIGVGLSPSTIAISPNGKYAYVSDYSSNAVTVISLPWFQITAQGCQTKNKFLSQTDLVNKLTWTVSGTELPVTYSIYRDAALTDLAGSVNASGPLEFLDHHRKSNVTYTYYIVGTNDLGMTLSPVEVVVSQKCK